MTEKDDKSYRSERSSRDKFKRERDDYPSRRDSDRDYYSSRRRRERSRSSGMSDHEERRSKRRRSTSPRGDHYIPNYSRDGYDPAPRYQGEQLMSGNDSFNSNNNNNGNNGNNNNNNNNGNNNNSNMVYMGSGYMNSNMMNNMMGMSGMFPGNWNGSRPIQDPNKLDTLVSFKYFSDYYRQKEKNMEEDELSRRYTIYKENFSHRQSQKFFELHKTEEWFKDKYHPVDSLVYREELIKRKIEMYNKFVKKLNDGDFDSVCFDEIEKSESSKEKETTTEKKEESNDSTNDIMDEAEDEEKKTSEEDVSKSNKLFIKSIPPNVKRKELIDLCSKINGFDYLAISDPNPQKKFHRLGWIVFTEGTDIKKAYDQLNNAKIDEFVFHLAYHQNLPTRNKTIPEIFSTTERLKHDLKQAKDLIIELDKEIGLDKTDTNGYEILEEKIENIDNNEEIDEIKKIKQKLDLYIEYLHQVHLFCYYNATEAESTEDYDRKCPILQRPQISSTASNENTQENTTTEAKDKLCERIDSKIGLRINRPKNAEDIEKIGGRNIDNEIDKYAGKNVVKVDEGKYRCKICSKLFKGESFVKKHIKSKHTELLEPLKLEVEFFNNYAQDIQKITGVFPSTINQNVMGMNMNMNNNMRMAMPQMMGQSIPWIVPPMMPPMGLGEMNLMPPKRNNGYMGSGYYRGMGRGGLNKKSLKKDENIKKFPKDPREIRSYVDLDAPVEGDINISYD